LALSRTQAHVVLWIMLGMIVLARRVPTPGFEFRSASNPASFTLDLNEATWQELVILDGIGEALAKKIVASRDAQGGFDTIEEAMEVPGVPDRPFQRARSYLKLSPRH